MVSPIRRAAAEDALGRRHPYATLYGGWVLALAVLAGLVAGAIWAWQHRPAGWTWSPASPFPWLPFVIFGVPLLILVWRHFGPGARFRRQMKRTRL